MLLVCRFVSFNTRECKVHACMLHAFTVSAIFNVYLSGFTGEFPPIATIALLLLTEPYLGHSCITLPVLLRILKSL